MGAPAARRAARRSRAGSVGRPRPLAQFFTRRARAGPA
eukprot:CAMPEP_0183807284 /NCGR_PEP_ID=MMETSP0803_2-20130417/41021_1 /TAXON_ID=195967 /ORGANISM="Crustomastix stigmata, Strain CCMP3273" /LENGTH=37 /DNA_ID= /DNA_START= /DNA_END= /DNA_ORIENTATION=